MRRSDRGQAARANAIIDSSYDLPRMLTATRNFWETETKHKLKSKDLNNQNILDTFAEAIDNLCNNRENCTAVAFETPNKNKLIISTNYVEHDAINNFMREVQNMPGGAQINDHHYVIDNSLAKHAEMKVLDWFSENRRNPGYIGISKPACLRCAMALILKNTDFCSTSGRIWNAGWKMPVCIGGTQMDSHKVSTDSLLKQFIGDESSFFKTSQEEYFKIHEVYDKFNGVNKYRYLTRLEGLEN